MKRKGASAYREIDTGTFGGVKAISLLDPSSHLQISGCREETSKAANVSGKGKDIVPLAWSIWS